MIQELEIQAVIGYTGINMYLFFKGKVIQGLILHPDNEVYNLFE